MCFLPLLKATRRNDFHNPSDLSSLPTEPNDGELSHLDRSLNFRSGELINLGSVHHTKDIMCVVHCKGRSGGYWDLQPRTVIINLNPPSFTFDFMICLIQAIFELDMLYCSCELVRRVDDLNAG